MQAERGAMPERGRHHQRSDVYAEYKSGDHSHGGGHASYDGRGRNQEPRGVEERGSAGDRRAKENRQRDVTTAYRDHDREGPSRL